MQPRILKPVRGNSLRPLLDKSIFWGVFPNFAAVWMIVVSIGRKRQRSEKVLHRELIPGVVLSVEKKNVMNI